MPDNEESPLVSVIVPTKNSAACLSRCLGSIRSQTYQMIELIVVDNHSQDETLEVAAYYADTVATRGPERSAQVNYGASIAAGKYIYKVDSDFVLEPSVIEECVLLAEGGAQAVIVHNSPDVTVGWLARIRKFEVYMYKYQMLFSSARFVMRDVFVDIGGFAEDITAGEDYDFQNRLNEGGYVTAFADAEALHLGEPQPLK